MGQAKARKYKETSYLKEGHRLPIYGIAFNHFNTKDNIFASAGSNRATVYKCLKNGTIEVLQVYHNADQTEDFYACQWSLDIDTGAPLLVIGGHHGLLRVINCITGAIECTLEGHGNCINDIAVHPLFPFIVATGSRDHSVRVYNIKTKVCVMILQGDGGHRNEVVTVDWKVDSDHFFRHQHCTTGSSSSGNNNNNNNNTNRGGGKKGKGGATNRGEGSSVLPAYAGGVHPCESLLATAGMDNTIKVWSLADFKDVLDRSMHWTEAMAAKASFRPRHVRVPIFSNDCVHTDATLNYVDCIKWHGDFIVSKSVDDKIIQWQPEIASSEEKQSYKAGRVKLIQIFKLEDCMRVWFSKFALDRSQTVLAVGTGKGKTLVFEPNGMGTAPVYKLTPQRLSEKRKKKTRSKEEEMLVRQIAVSGDGDIIVSSHEDGTITRFDRTTSSSGDDMKTDEEEEEEEEKEGDRNEDEEDDVVDLLIEGE